MSGIETAELSHKVIIFASTIGTCLSSKDHYIRLELHDRWTFSALDEIIPDAINVLRLESRDKNMKILTVLDT
jgi:hypothetical protein